MFELSTSQSIIRPGLLLIWPETEYEVAGHNKDMWKLDVFEGLPEAQTNRNACL